MDAARPKESLDASLKTSKGNESLLKPASSSAFANSTFGKLASSSVSPFATVAGAGKPSLFGSSSSSGSSSIFGGGSSTTTKPTNPTGPPKLSFGSASGASPFATAAAPANGQAGGSIFKTSAFASPFGASALSGSRLTFGKPGEALKSDKPAKPFGAPDSDAEEGSGEESGGEDGDEAKGDGSSDEGGAKDEKEEARAGEDKKKPKLQKGEFRIIWFCLLEINC
jgi:Ran-binding protein 3